MTANFAIVFSGPAIRRARRELVNIQGGTIALLVDCNSSLPFLSSPFPSPVDETLRVKNDWNWWSNLVIKVQLDIFL